MDNYRDETRLIIIRRHCRAIEKGLKVIKTYEQFIDEKNELYKNAILYSVLQIGENVYNLSDEFKTNNNKIPWGQIVKTRHIVVHHYYEINDAKIWEVCTKDIPILKKFINNKIKENNIDTSSSNLQLKKPS